MQEGAVKEGCSTARKKTASSKVKGCPNSKGKGQQTAKRRAVPKAASLDHKGRGLRRGRGHKTQPKTWAKRVPKGA
jgi:hypothetical protein